LKINVDCYVNLDHKGAMNESLPAADCADGHTRLPAVNGVVRCRWCDEVWRESDLPELSIYDLIYEN
jgi:hypothetical protein